VINAMTEVAEGKAIRGDFGQSKISPGSGARKAGSGRGLSGERNGRQNSDHGWHGFHGWGRRRIGGDAEPWSVPCRLARSE